MALHVAHENEVMHGGSLTYWVPIQDEHAAKSRHKSSGFFSYMGEVVGLKHTPCPPWCHAPAPIGRGFLMAVPAYTFLILLAASFIFSVGAIPWLKIIIGSLLGIPGGFGLGYLYYLGSHTAIPHFDIALSREKLHEEIEKHG